MSIGGGLKGYWDWCGWCVKLREESLDTQAFEKFAADNLILFEADFRSS